MGIDYGARSARAESSQLKELAQYIKVEQKREAVEGQSKSTKSSNVTNRRVSWKAGRRSLVPALMSCGGVFGDWSWHWISTAAQNVVGNELGLCALNEACLRMGLADTQALFHIYFSPSTSFDDCLSCSTICLFTFIGTSFANLRCCQCTVNTWLQG